MTFEEFKKIVGGDTGKVTESNYPTLCMMAEIVVQDLMVYRKDELSGMGLEAYNEALALQMVYTSEEGLTEGNLVSQTINGTTTTFALKNAGGDALKVSPLVKASVRRSGLCVR